VCAGRKGSGADSECAGGNCRGIDTDTGTRCVRAGGTGLGYDSTGSDGAGSGGTGSGMGSCTSDVGRVGRIGTTSSE